MDYADVGKIATFLAHFFFQQRARLNAGRDVDAKGNTQTRKGTRIV